MPTYTKFRFSHPIYGATAGLVMETARLGAMTIPEISRLFPAKEAAKMARLERSETYPSREEAFAHVFPSAHGRAR